VAFFSLFFLRILMSKYIPSYTFFVFGIFLGPATNDRGAIKASAALLFSCLLRLLPQQPIDFVSSEREFV
jgi:hypothetical protein